MKKFSLLILAALICSCALAPVPVWKDKAYQQLEDYKKYFLAGKEDAAEPHFIKARKEVASSNDLNLLAAVLLTRYALHTAALEDFDDSELISINKLEPDAANLSYCYFLKGNFRAVDAKVLPSRYSGIIKAAAGQDATSAAREIAAIDDPLSRLVACGVWIKYMPCDENILQIAINTASANGWRRPLWAYLNKLHACYYERGDKNKADIVKDRLELLKK